MPLAAALLALAFLFAFALWRDFSAALPMPPAHGPDIWARCRDFDRWDRGMRRQFGLFAGLMFFHRTNSKRSFNLIVRHWPHLLCWQWVLAFNVAVADEGRHFFRFCGMTRPSIHGGQSWTLHLFWIGYLHYQRQASDRIAAMGPIGRDAPVIYPREVRAAA